MTKRKMIRVALNGEMAWGEHIKDNTYRALNECFDSVATKYPPEHERYKLNGQKKRLAWGDIFEGEETNMGRKGEIIRPTFIIGSDLTPPTED